MCGSRIRDLKVVGKKRSSPPKVAFQSQRRFGIGKSLKKAFGAYF
jgi:hypothetical protein